MDRRWCRWARKRRFRDHLEAVEALRRIARKPRGRVPVRVYRCAGCKGWHLTSQATRGGS